jgi:hypothetical protein
MQGSACQCGMIVFEPGELDEAGLCLFCAGAGHECGCACVECELYLIELDRSGEPGPALEAALTSVVSSGGSGSR